MKLSEWLNQRSLVRHDLQLGVLLLILHDSFSSPPALRGLLLVFSFLLTIRVWIHKTPKKVIDE